MSIRTEIDRINGNIANAYTKASEKGAILPTTQNSENLASTIDSIQSSGGGSDKLASLVDKSITEVTAEDLAGVTSIGEYAFSRCSSLTSVTIPDSVTSIEGSAFQSCSNLPSIDIPSSVTSIGISAFRYCTSFFNITIPEGVTSIGQSAFADCGNLITVTIPSSVTSIGSSVFSGNKKIVQIRNLSKKTLSTSQLPNARGQEIITNNNPFKNTLAYGEKYITYKINDTTSNYYNDKYLMGFVIEKLNTETTLNDIPNDITDLFPYAFEETNVITATIPTNVTKILQGAFHNCDSLRTIQLHDNVELSGGNIFQGCSSLEAITIPAATTTLTSTTFQSCTSLTSVTLPATITSMNGSVFSSCTGLTTANVYMLSSTTKVTANYNGWFYNCSESLVIHASSTLDATTSKTAFGNYWNYRTSSAMHTTYYDL